GRQVSRYPRKRLLITVAQQLPKHVHRQGGAWITLLPIVTNDPQNRVDTPVKDARRRTQVERRPVDQGKPIDNVTSLGQQAGSFQSQHGTPTIAAKAEWSLRLHFQDQGHTLGSHLRARGRNRFLSESMLRHRNEGLVWAEERGETPRIVSTSCVIAMEEEQRPTVAIRLDMNKGSRP